VSLSPGHLIICGDVPRHVFCLKKLRDDWDKLGNHSVLEELRSEGGEAMVLENNYFIEEILPNAILRRLSDEGMKEYRRPFAEPGEGRRPTLTWPVAGEPADVPAIATECVDWLGTSNVPKLFLTVEPGAFLAIDTLVNLVRVASAHREDGARIHFVQKDSPDEIGRAIAGWMLK
jgi:haloalkane dehalogenase